MGALNTVMLRTSWLVPNCPSRASTSGSAHKADTQSAAAMVNAASVGNPETTPHDQGPEGPAGQRLTTANHKRLREGPRRARSATVFLKQAGWKASATVAQTVFSVKTEGREGVNLLLCEVSNCSPYFRCCGGREEAAQGSPLSIWGHPAFHTLSILKRPASRWQLTRSRNSACAFRFLSYKAVSWMI